MKPYNNDNKSKSQEVREMFDNIAPTYDRLNHILSLNIDKLWRRRVVSHVASGKPLNILDLATGTGDLAIAIAQRVPSAHIVAADPSAGMLAVAQKKVAKHSLEHQIETVLTSAEQLALPSAHFDVATVAFGVRNFGNLSQGLEQIHRVLRPGGRVIILEFSKCRNPLVAPLYRLYSRWIMPWVGGVISNDRAAYDYLPQSIEEFDNPTQFLATLKNCGFVQCSAESKSFGIAQIYTAQKL